MCWCHVECRHVRDTGHATNRMYLCYKRHNKLVYVLSWNAEKSSCQVHQLFHGPQNYQDMIQH